MATKEQRRARHDRRAARLLREQSDTPRKKPPDERQQAVAAARAELSKTLAGLDMQYQPKIAELLAEYGEKKRQARAGYEERVELIKKAHLLGD